MTVQERDEHFTVDAKLLRELGERLVGRPHIALAELIKNAYDADARLVEVRFRRGRIEVVDDGHGMSEPDFIGRWLRIATDQKERDRRSPELGRLLTGSKGVGRLAAQVLAGHLVLTTRALLDASLPGTAKRRASGPGDLADGVRAEIHWEDAIASQDLQTVAVAVGPTTEHIRFAADSRCGTRVVLEGLHRRWGSKDFRRLAEQIWHLQPPFVEPESEDRFQVQLDSQYQSIVDTFDEQMSAIFDIWSARIRLELREDDPEVEAFELQGMSLTNEDDSDDLEGVDDGEGDRTSAGGNWQESLAPPRLVDITVQLRDAEPRTVTYRVPSCRLQRVDAEIRVFDLVSRQPLGVSVRTAREYLDRWGGVGIYDGGFRLPYYGADQDWLSLDLDSARRLSSSDLVPESLAVPRGLQDLPTNRRVYGQVRVSTTDEAEAAGEVGIPSNEILGVLVTRDRLVDNEAYQQLRVIVRSSLDLYAMELASTRVIKARGRRSGPTSRDASDLFALVRDAVDTVADRLPVPTYRDIRRTIDSAIDAAEALEESSREHAGLLGALATAGMTSIAYEHEVDRQLKVLADLADSLRELAAGLTKEPATHVGTAAESISAWVVRAQSIRGIFAPLRDEETRTARGRFHALQIAKEVASQLEVLSHGATVDTNGIPAELVLPEGSYPAWSAVFQNLYANAFNAVLDMTVKRVIVTGGGNARRGWVEVADTGNGVDLAEGERLFKPFERGRPASRRRAALALGGTGLGLTIVRMVADELGCTVTFVQPGPDMSTAIRIAWEGLR